MISRIARFSTLIGRVKMPDINKARPSSSYESYEAIASDAYDLMLTDINEVGFKHLADRTGIPNLTGGSFTAPPFPVKGVIFGPNNRLMVCLNCRRAEMPSAPIFEVWFLTDTGSNPTFLSAETMSKLTGSDYVPSSTIVSIQDPDSVIECDLSHSHFKEANVLGMTAMRKMNLSIEGINWSVESWKLVKQ